MLGKIFEAPHAKEVEENVNVFCYCWMLECFALPMFVNKYSMLNEEDDEKVLIEMFIDIRILLIFSVCN